MTEKDNVEIDEERELFHAFLEECDEYLDEIESHSIALETDASNRERINGVFRAVHSLKGNSSFFHFTNVQTFCHTLESFLDLIREKKIDTGQDVVNVILEGADHLKAIFSRLHDAGGLDVILTGKESDYLRMIDERVGPAGDKERLETLRKELLRYFTRVKGEDGFIDGSPVKEIYDLIRTYAPFLVNDKRRADGENGTMWKRGAVDVTREYQTLRSLVDHALAGEHDENAFETFMKSVDALIAKHRQAQDVDVAESLRAMKEDFDMFYQDEIGIDEMLAGTLAGALDEYAKGLTEEKPKDSKEVHPAPGPGPREPAGQMERRARFVRVNETLLDEFLDQVGELITLNELFSYIQRTLERDDLKGLAMNFKNTNQSFRELTSQLQRSLYEVRKAPLSGALCKLPRIVRNIARNSGKQIRLSTTGGDTEIDRSALERLETILVHLVRNSADHGIESPETRTAAGKNPEGIISIDVTSDKLSLFIAVADDGRGVNLEKVRNVAVERGLLAPEEASKLSEREALNLILQPGFSTAGVVTETSGRGVGMDVLVTGVQEMGGSMTLTSVHGKGMTLRIAMPLAYTTRIKLGLTLAVGSSVFLAPAESVRESFRARPEDVSTVEGRGEVVQRWGRFYPIVRLHRLFGTAAVHENIWDAICVLVESRGETVCLVVDEMIGQRQIVYKQLTVQTKEPSLFEGVSILDGTRMALILSVDGIIRQIQGR